MEYPYLSAQTQETITRIKITNKFFGEFEYCKILKQTEKAYLIEPIGNASISDNQYSQWVKGKRYIYKRKWIPKKAMRIEGVVEGIVYTYKMSVVPNDYQYVVEIGEGNAKGKNE